MKHRKWHSAAFGEDSSGWLALAVGLAAAGAAGGFVLSFTNLGHAARAHGWDPWWMLPLILDSGVPAYIIADHWLIAHGHRSLFARLATWACAAATVILNGAVSTDPHALWRWSHMLAPALWILGVEAVRRMWVARHKGEQPARDQITFAQWAASPWRTTGLWRRRHVLGVPWSQMLALEDARLFLSSIAEAITGQPVPAAIIRVVDTGRLPAHLAATVTSGDAASWEPVLVEWAGRQVALPDVLLAAVSAATPDPLPETETPLPDPHLEDTRTPLQDPHPEPSRPPRPDRRRDPSQDSRHGRDMTAQEVADFAAEHLGRVPVPSVNQIVALSRQRLASGVGRPKAIEAHTLLDPAARVKAAK